MFNSVDSLQPERTKRPQLKALFDHEFFEKNLKENTLIKTPVADWLQSIKSDKI